MHFSLDKVLVFIIIVFVVGLYYEHRPYLKDDEAICAALAKDPAKLPFISYGTKKGFDECVARCMTSVMMQVCRQLPPKSNVFGMHPEVKEQMLAGCIQNINDFVTNNTRCPYLNCEP